jgi:uncharacterized damage-inducible protein DinB
MPLAEQFVAELEHEAAATRQLLQRVPPQFEWRPDPKSMTLGQLAQHVAEIPGAFASILTPDGVDFATVGFTATDPDAGTDFAQVLDQSVASAEVWLHQLNDEMARGMYRASLAGVELFVVPRLELVRSLMFNHWYHHRGQLTVYLRLLGVALPPLYGPTADENLFEPGSAA